MGRRRQPFRYLVRLSPDAVAVPEGTAPPAPEALTRMMQSLRRQGQRDPVLALALAPLPPAFWSAPSPDRPEPEPPAAPVCRLVQGRLRLAAVRELGWGVIQAVVLPPDFAPEVAVLEDPAAGPWELAETLASLQRRCGWTQAQVGAAVGRNRDFVAGLAAIGDIRPEVRTLIATHPAGAGLSARHLRYVGRAAPGRQARLAREILEQGLTTKALEERLRTGRGESALIKVRELPQPGRARSPQTTREWRRYYRKLRTDLSRVDAQEREALRRTQQVIDEARGRQRRIRSEAGSKRRQLTRELRRATRQLTRRGAL